MPGVELPAHFVLELEGVTAGLLVAAEGGDISAPVVRDPSSPDAFVRKHLGLAQYEDIVLKAGLTMDKSFYEWIGEAWAGKSLRRRGAVLTIDPNNQIRTRREFTNAFIIETALPVMDGGSKDPAFLTVRISPEKSTDLKGLGQTVSTAKVGVATKRWLCSNFRLEMPGLETSHVRRVEAFPVVTRGQDSTGSDTTAAKVDFPDLRVLVQEFDAPTWRLWFDDFVLKGNNDPAHTKTGALRFLTPDLKTTLGHVTFEGLGIRRLARTTPRADNEIALLVADLYCERMELTVGPA